MIEKYLIIFGLISVFGWGIIAPIAILACIGNRALDKRKYVRR